jgi:hypothetical protein
MMSRIRRAALLVMLGLAGAAFSTASSPGTARAETSPTDGSRLASEKRPDYDCWKGGFCGSEGWAYGAYAQDTKESTGCGRGKDGVDWWDYAAVRAITLPDFARPYCAFFYGFQLCSVQTVVCEN